MSVLCTLQRQIYTSTLVQNTAREELGQSHSNLATTVSVLKAPNVVTLYFFLSNIASKELQKFFSGGTLDFCTCKIYISSSLQPVTVLRVSIFNVPVPL